MQELEDHQVQPVTDCEQGMSEPNLAAREAQQGNYWGFALLLGCAM